jgi:tryptophanyl-tRNA synthetase
MVTDPARVKRKDPGNPEVCAVFDFHKIYSTSTIIHQINNECRTAAIGCIDCKKFLADAMVERISPIWEARKTLEGNPKRLEEVVQSGCKQATKISRETLSEVKEAMKI